MKWRLIRASTGRLFGLKSLNTDQLRIRLTASKIHPAIKDRPPIGVIDPSQRTPDKTRMYRLPENIIIPAVIIRAGITITF